jgi:hypothetical protein
LSLPFSVLDFLEAVAQLHLDVEHGTKRPRRRNRAPQRTRKDGHPRRGFIRLRERRRHGLAIGRQIGVKARAAKSVRAAERGLAMPQQVEVMAHV